MSPVWVIVGGVTAYVSVGVVVARKWARWEGLGGDDDVEYGMVGLAVVFWPMIFVVWGLVVVGRFIAGDHEEWRT